MYQISGGKERGKIQTSVCSLEKTLELPNNDLGIADKLSKAWNNRLEFPPRELPKRYMGGYLAIHLHGSLVLNERSWAFCLVVLHEGPHSLRPELSSQNAIEQCEFPMLIESVHLVDDKKRTVLRVGAKGTVWLKSLDECLGIGVRDSLYLSLISGKFIFTNRLNIKNRELDSVGMVKPIGAARQLPHQMIQARPEMVHNLSCQNAKPEWDRSVKMVISDYLKHLVILIWDDGILAVVEKGIDLPIEITDTLVGPFDLLVDPL